MNREKAIDLLDNLIGMVEDNQESDYDTALKMAIQALSHSRVKNELNVELNELKPCEDAISRDEVIDILLNEMECVQRASDEECNRNCAKCDLLRDTNKILQAYRISIKALEHPEENVVAIVPCGDAISRQDAIDAINTAWAIDDLDNLTNAMLTDTIKSLPSVTPQQKYGKWKREQFPNFKVAWFCNKCGGGTYHKSNYCPNCGAKMVEPQESEDKE